MDRSIAYTSEQGRSTDFLFAQRAAMIGLAKLTGTTLGTGTIVDGLQTTQTSPASLSVQVAIGKIYSPQPVDATAYGVLPADTSDTIVKQGLLMTPATLATPAPTTAGYSINYLIQAAYQDQDTNFVVLPYFNSANPLQPLTGQNNSGAPQATQRQGICVISAKAGAAATTGSQTTPAPDSGYVGLYVVTVAYGASTVVNANISAYPGAPVLPASILSSIQQGALVYGVDTGAANAAVVAHTPPVTTLKDGMVLRFKAAAANTAATTLNVDGLGASPVVNIALTALTGGEILAGSQYAVIWSAAISSWVLLRSTIASQSEVNAGTDDAKFVTSKKLRWGFSASFTINGYVAFPSWLGGFLIQWGNLAPTAALTATTLTYPIAFPTACLSAALLPTNTAGTAAQAWRVSALTATNFTFASSVGSSGFIFWIAIGN